MQFLSQSRQREGGNVLFLILIAVVLFGALSFAISEGSRNSQKDAGQEKIESTAAALMQYAATIENAVTRVRVSNACLDTEISFATPIYEDLSSAVYNPDGRFNDPYPDKRCHVFESTGGQAIALVFPSAVIMGQTAGPLKSGHATLIIANVPRIGSSQPDLILALPSIRRDVCLRAQVKANGPSFSGEVGNCVWTDYTGSFAASPACDAGVNNVWTWCGVDAANSESANFYHIVMPR